MLERLSDAVAEPISCTGQQLQVTASVGVALLDPNAEPNLEDLVRRADEAMYQVKRAGRSAIIVHR